MDGGGRILRSLNGTRAEGGGAPGFADEVVSPRLTLRKGPLSRAFERAHRRLPRFLGSAFLVALFGCVGAYGAVHGGHYSEFRALYGEPRDFAARLMGLGIDTVTITGLAELDETEVLQVAGIDPRGSLLFFDVATARERLLSIPLVREAAVRKLYPGALTIAVVERDAFALWQNHGEVFVIAADGTVIDSLADSRFNRLPLVVGEGANTKATAFVRLMDGAPEVRAHVRAGVFVGQRRWTLKMDNGVDVRLPELGTTQALTRLAGLMREQKILEKDVLAIDLRMPDRVVLRLTEEAAAQRLEANKGKPKGGKGSVI